MVTKLDASLSFQHQALSLRAYRQQVIAANIANSDTPNFKARDIDFSAALKNAVAGRGGAGLEMARTSGQHMTASGEAGAAPLLYRKEMQPSADGNTVNMDIERSQFSENSIQYEAGVTFITHQLRMMTAAVAPGQ